MTTPKNPERLWAARYRDEDGFEYIAVFEQPEHAKESHRHGADADVQTYVREDVAAQREAAVEAERERVLLELRGTLVRCCVDFAEDEAHAGGLAHAVRCIEDLIAEKKGQAK